ncbi:MAG: FkbM family methyltransferase [Alcanivoracaceae bacterium]|nr:FkbM family methyltransferase [Alcanivoracaceae bacterium]
MDSVFGNLGKFHLNRLRDSKLRSENISAISSKCQNAYLGNYQSICRILGRFKIYIDSRDRTLGPYLLMDGFWEIQITECIAKNVKQGMNVIDLGANYGYYSLLMAGLIGNKGNKVYSIEANPNIFSLLKNSIRINGFKNKVDPINIAVIDGEAQEMQFSFKNDSAMNGHLEVYRKKSNIEESIIVKANNLDNIIPVGEKIDFIKVDIEGAEHMFWQGSSRIRKDNPDIKILLEFNARRYQYVEQFIDSIIDEGFSIKQIKRTPDLDCYLTKEDLLGLPTHSHVMLLLEH